MITVNEFINLCDKDMPVIACYKSNGRVICQLNPIYASMEKWFEKLGSKKVVKIRVKDSAVRIYVDVKSSEIE